MLSTCMCALELCETRRCLLLHLFLTKAILWRGQFILHYLFCSSWFPNYPFILYSSMKPLDISVSPKGQTSWRKGNMFLMYCVEVKSEAFLCVVQSIFIIVLKKKKKTHLSVPVCFYFLSKNQKFPFSVCLMYCAPVEPCVTNKLIHLLHTV